MNSDTCDLVLRCPWCGHGAESMGHGRYRCGDDHEFWVRRCEYCQSPIVEQRPGEWICTNTRCAVER